MWFQYAGYDLGYLPQIILLEDPRPAREQIAERYAHGGGYSPFGEGKWSFDKKTVQLTFTGDPPLHAVAYVELPKSGEKIVVFECDMVCISSDNFDTFDVVRMD